MATTIGTTNLTLPDDSYYATRTPIFAWKSGTFNNTVTYVDTGQVIPTTARTIWITFRSISFAGTDTLSFLMVRTTGFVQSTGYSWSTSAFTGTSGGKNSGWPDSYFVLWNTALSASYLHSGTITLNRVGNTYNYVADWQLGSVSGSTNRMSIGSGRVSLSTTTVGGFRFGGTSGTNLDGGDISIHYA